MNQLKRRRVKRREKEDFIKMKSIFCVWLWLWMAMWKKSGMESHSSQLKFNSSVLHYAQQRWFCSCETKWDFYAKDIEDICNCIYSEPSPLCDFYLASCDISPYGRSTGGKWLTIRLNWLWIHFIQTTSSDGSFCLSHLKEKDRACGLVRSFWSLKKHRQFRSPFLASKLWK